jgi:hypothetical protein
VSAEEGTVERESDPVQMFALCMVLVICAVVFLCIGLAVGYWCR